MARDAICSLCCRQTGLSNDAAGPCSLAAVRWLHRCCVQELDNLRKCVTNTLYKTTGATILGAVGGFIGAFMQGRTALAAAPDAAASICFTACCCCVVLGSDCSARCCCRCVMLSVSRSIFPPRGRLLPLAFGATSALLCASAIKYRGLQSCTREFVTQQPPAMYPLAAKARQQSAAQRTNATSPRRMRQHVGMACESMRCSLCSLCSASCCSLRSLYPEHPSLATFVHEAPTPAEPIEQA